MLWEVHQDTVPVEGMTIPPFSGELREGRVLGRGATDIKGGMASMLTAFHRLSQEPDQIPGTLVLACTINEEHGFTGAKALVKGWEDGALKLLPRKPDGVVVAEPTSLDVVVAHKGVVRWSCCTVGRAAHSSQPHLGDNAIYKMAKIVTALEEYHQNVVGELGNHPLLGSPTLSVGVIRGGVGVNIVPDGCFVEIDRRMLPSEDPAQVQRHVHEYLARVTPYGDEIEFSEPYIIALGLPDTNNDALASAVQLAAERCGRTCKRIGVDYGTDASAFGPAGASTVVVGPGSIAQAHTKDEYIVAAEVERAVDVYYELGKIELTRG